MGKGIGGFISSIFGSDNEHESENVQPDAMNYMYGGAGGADAAANRYRNTAEQAQNRQGVNVNYSQANLDRAHGMQARRQQAGMADLMARRARGEVPSIAQMQADRQMGQMTAAQASAGASARGAAGLALAQQGAANNTANAQSAISNQAQINAAQERMQAENAAFGAYSGMRGGDLASQQQAAQQQQFQAQLYDAQRGRNDAMTMGMSQLEHGVRSTDLGAHMNFEAQKTGNRMGSDSINAGVAGQNAGMNQTNGMGVIGMFRDGVGAAGGLLGKAAGGPVGGQQPYLVGEKGPELIVPAQDGYVIPAGRTREILSRANGGPVGGVGFSGLFGGGASALGAGGGANTNLGTEWNNSELAGMTRGRGMASMGGALQMRAHGGPVKGYYARAEGGPVYAPSTWGQGGPDVAAQQAAMNEAAVQRAVGQQLVRQAAAVESPWERDVRQVQALRQASPDLVSDEDDERERRGRGILGMARKDAQKEKTADKARTADKAAAPAAKKEDTIDRMMRAPVASYQPMGHYVPPQLLPVVTRAGGGAVEGAMPLYEPPGQQLHQTADGHAFLAMEPAREVPLAGGGLAAMSSSRPVVASVPVSKTAANAPKRKQSEDELRRAAAALEMQMRSDHAARMGAGPAVVAREGGGPVKAGGEPFDWEKNKQRSSLRDPKDFKRDTPADQRAIKRAHEDAAAREADKLIASYGRALDNGPSVGRLVADYEVEEPRPAPMRLASNEPPDWLTNYMVSREEGGPVEGATEPDGFVPAPAPHPLPAPPPAWKFAMSKEEKDKALTDFILGPEGDRDSGDYEDEIRPELEGFVPAPAPHPLPLPPPPPMKRPPAKVAPKAQPAPAKQAVQVVPATTPQGAVVFFAKRPEGQPTALAQMKPPEKRATMNRTQAPTGRRRK